MKRTLAIIVFAVLLLSAVGATIAVAKDNQPAGKSNVWQQSVTVTNPDGSTDYGKFVADMKHNTFTFAAEKCQPGTTYYVYCVRDPGPGAMYSAAFGSAQALDDGTLYITGSYPGTATDLSTIAVSPFLVTIVSNYPAPGTWFLLANVAGGVQPIVDYTWKLYRDDNYVATFPSHDYKLSLGPIYQQPYSVTVTVTDSGGNTATSPPASYNPSI